MALDQYNEEEEEDENGMSFLDHLEQLRWHLLRSVSAILVFMVAAFLSKGFVFGQVILGPAKVDFVNLSVQDYMPKNEMPQEEQFSLLVYCSS